MLYNICPHTSSTYRPWEPTADQEDYWNFWTFDLIPTFLHNRRIRPCMHALNIPSDVIKTSEKKNLWSSQEALEIFQKWIKVIQYSAQCRLINRKKKKGNFAHVLDVLEGHLCSPNQKLLLLKACFGMSLIFNYKWTCHRGIQKTNRPCLQS